MKYKNTLEEYNTMSNEEKTYFYIRCKEDPIFFIENCVVAPTVGGYKQVTLYEPQKEIIRSFVIDHHIIMNKSRQTGGSFCTQGLCSWLVLFQENYVIGVVSRSGPESSSYNKKVLDILDNIPQDFMRPESWDYVERNQQSFTLKTTGSKLISQAVSQQKPEGILRGNSIVTLVLDEVAFIDHIDTAFTALMPTVSIAQKAADDAKIPYGNFIISTPNGMKGRGEWYYKQWCKAKTEKSLYKAKKIHWRDIPGLDDEWYRKQCDALNNDPKKIQQEMELAFISSDGSFWSDEVQIHLNNLMNSDLDPSVKIIEYMDGGTLTMFNFNFDVTKFYLIGVDIASENGSDNSVIQVIDFETCEQVAEYVGKLEILKFTQIVKDIAVMFPNNLLIIENTGGFGLAILNILNNDESNFNIYGETRMTGVGVKKRMKFVAGITTSSKTRPLIIESMYDHVKNNLDLIKSPRLASELLSLTNKNGKVQASPGNTDDMVMAYAFCFYVRKYSPESYQDILGNLKKGQSMTDYLRSPGNEEIDEFAAKMSMDVTNTYPDHYKYGITTQEYTQMQHALKPTNTEKDFTDDAFDIIIGNDYDNDKEEDMMDFIDMMADL